MFTIGRTMFETDRIPAGWVERLNFMDEIWVPTEFSRVIFSAAGISNQKLRVVPEPVDTEFFKPSSIKKSLNNETVFLFVGKWEERKGLKILLRAFFKEFSGEEKVKLIIVTSAYHSTDRFWDEIQLFVNSESLTTPIQLRQRVNVISGIPYEDMPILYQSSSALVCFILYFYSFL